MKSITERLITERSQWNFYPCVDDNKCISLPSNIKYLCINTEGENITGISAKELASYKEEFDDEETEKAVKKLKVGETYNADGGINIYVRIK